METKIWVWIKGILLVEEIINLWIQDKGICLRIWISNNIMETIISNNKCTNSICNRCYIIKMEIWKIMMNNILKEIIIIKDEK